MKNLLFFAALLVSITTIAQQTPVCPLGPKDDHLNVHRVMINFGRYVGGPDNLVLMGARYPNEIVDEKALAQAAPSLLIAAACAQAVIDNPTGDMLPDKASFLQGDDRLRYIDDFIYFMGEFHDALLHYSHSFADLAALPQASRNWEALYAESKQINELIDRAHRKTSLNTPQSVLENMPSQGLSLKENMKEINVRYKAISAAATDVAQYPAFAVLAGEISQLFVICKNQVPPSFASMPPDVRAKATAEYQAAIEQVADLGANLAKALQARDTAAVQALLLQLKNSKVDGHNKFDP